MSEFGFKLDQMTRAVRSGKLSRRDFMQTLVATGLTAMAANSLFAGAARAEPKVGGAFRAALGNGQTTDSLDPATWSSGFTFAFGKSVMGAPLVQVSAENKAVPHVAESFEPSKKAQQWAFKIRKGITFHDGRTLTPKDVIATLNYHRGPNSKSPAKQVLSSIVSMKADGPDLVVFELDGPNADFPFLFTDYHLSIYPAKGDSIDWEKGMGAGPYILESFEPGIRLTGKRNPNYFATTWFDTIEILAIPDVTARTNAYIAGEVHYINRADLKTIEFLKAVPDTALYNVPGFSHYCAPMMVDQKPFDNVDVRQALKYAFNRQELVDKILHGYGKAGNDNPIPDTMIGAINPKPVHSYDPDRTKSLLKRAGMENLKLDFSASDAVFSGGLDMASLMAEQAKASGISINVVREPNDSYWDTVWLKKPWCESQWGGRPTIGMFMEVALAQDAPWNETHWKNPRFNKLLLEARSELDDRKRAEMYAECQQLVHDDSGQIVLMFNNFVGALSAKIGHNAFNTDFDDDGGYMYERWWMV